MDLMELIKQTFLLRRRDILEESVRLLNQVAADSAQRGLLHSSYHINRIYDIHLASAKKVWLALESTIQETQKDVDINIIEEKESEIRKYSASIIEEFSLWIDKNTLAACSINGDSRSWVAYEEVCYSER